MYSLNAVFPTMSSVTETVQVLLVLIQVHYANSEIRVQPRDTEAVVGQMAFLNCSTSLPSKRILWYHYPVGASESNYVFLMGQLQKPYDKRYKVETQSKEEFNLVIRSVETSDAGKYVCQEEGENGQHQVAELIVLDANPVCGSNMKEDGVIGANSCDVKTEELQLSCTVSFHGNFPPVVEWSEVGNDGTIGEGIQQEISSRHVPSFLTISGNQTRNGSSFICQTKRSSTEQSRCVSDVIKIINVFDTFASTQAAVGENATCVANSSQPCVYKWKWSDDENDEIASNEATVTFSKPGSYRCEAQCKIRQKSCTVIAKLVQVYPVISTSENMDRQNFLVVSSSLIVITAFVTCLVVFLVLYGRLRHLIGSTEEKKPMLPDSGSTEATKQELHHLEIYGLTKLNEEVFISRLHSGQVEVYDSSKQFAFKRAWRIQDLLYPADLICVDNHICLFDFKDLGQDCEIFIATSAGALVNKWSTGNNWGAIAPTYDSHIILTAYTTHTLFEYASDGKLLRQIVLEVAEILNPWHSIKLTKNKYVVCQGRHGLPLHRVCLVRLKDEDVEGEINIDKDDVIKTFGGAKGSSPTEVDCPIRLNVDAKGSIYVADHYNGRVLMLDSDLKLIKEIVSAKEHGLRRPRRMHLDEENDKLLVADYFRVLDCQLSQNRAQWFDINTDNLANNGSK